MSQKNSWQNFVTTSSSLRDVKTKTLTYGSWNNVPKIFFVIIKISLGHFGYLQVCTIDKGFSGFSVLKAKSLTMIGKVENYVFSKQPQPVNFLCMQRIEVISVLPRKLLCIMLTVGWCPQQILFVKRKIKGQCYSDKTRHRKLWSILPYEYFYHTWYFPLCMYGHIRLWLYILLWLYLGRPDIIFKLLTIFKKSSWVFPLFTSVFSSSFFKLLQKNSFIVFQICLPSVILMLSKFS